MIPYLAPDAPMPITSWAPRLAEMNASPVIQAGIDRPERKKSVLRLHEPLQGHADAQHEQRVDDENRIVDRAERTISIDAPLENGRAKDNRDYRCWRGSCKSQWPAPKVIHRGGPTGSSYHRNSLQQNHPRVVRNRH